MGKAYQSDMHFCPLEWCFCSQVVRIDYVVFVDSVGAKRIKVAKTVKTAKSAKTAKRVINRQGNKKNRWSDQRF